MSEHKDTKAAVLYFRPASIGRAAGARCGACWKFIRGPGECLEVKGSIRAAGVCGLYVNGVAHPTHPNHAWRITRVSKEEAGYTDEGDTHCVSCTYMANPGNATSACEEVEGIVEQRGCCNEHERR